MQRLAQFVRLLFAVGVCAFVISALSPLDDEDQLVPDDDAPQQASAPDEASIRLSLPAAPVILISIRDIPALPLPFELPTLAFHGDTIVDHVFRLLRRLAPKAVRPPPAPSNF
jgi:hypothetical protein